MGELMRKLPITLGMLFIFAGEAAHARDQGQWGNTDPELRKWYSGLMQPDVPTASCCGEGDAYWADQIKVRDGKVYAIITDDRPDEPLKRMHVDVGTEIEIPNNKVKWGATDPDKTEFKNPTGHGVVFLSTGKYVFCYVSPGGV